MNECDGLSNANAPCVAVHGDKTTWMHVETKQMEDEGNDAWIGYGDPGGMGRRWKIGNVDKALPFFEDAYVEKLNEDGKPWCCQQSGGGCDRLAKCNVGVARTSHRNQDKTVQVNATRPSP